MKYQRKVSRRDFIKGAIATGAALQLTGWNGVDLALAANQSKVFVVNQCPVHDGQLRHIGLDSLFNLLAGNGVKFYKTTTPHSWGDANGIIASNDIVIIKINCQWSFRGMTNMDLLRGLIYRILQHPDGFTGEVIVLENGQGKGGFDGLPRQETTYYPTEVWGQVHVNAEASEESTLTVNYITNTVFSGYPVSAKLMDSLRLTFVGDTDHSTDGFRKTTDLENVSYPCFTSAGSHRIELREGIWNGSGYDTNLKLINMPVLKHHDGTGITGALKHTYGLLSMEDGSRSIRHYTKAGTQWGKMYCNVRTPDLNIVDCIWICHEYMCGYPPERTYRSNALVAGFDPVALDYYSSKCILLPAGGIYASYHNPDTSSQLVTCLTAARDYINSNCLIHGEPARMGDSNIEVISSTVPVTVSQFEAI